MKRIIIFLCASCFVDAALAQEINKQAAATETETVKSLNKSTMDNQSFTTTIVLDLSPHEVFKAITNVSGWWSEEIEGATEKVNDEFNYHYEDIHRAKMRLIEVIPNKKVVWLVLDNQFKFTKDKNEWKGNKIVFEISEKGKKTQLQFTQLGLVPEYECYDVCKEGWTNYIQNSLRGLITTGKGQPNATGKPRTETEKKLASSHQ